MSRIWVVGSLNVDLVVQCSRFAQPGETIHGQDYEELPGGKGGNQAVAAARLGGRTLMVGALGSDDRGRHYRSQLDAEGVDTTQVRVDTRPTGMALIEVASGENRIVVVPGANASLTPEAVVRALSALSPGDLVLLQLEIPLDTVEAALKVSRQRGAVVILDPAPARPLPPDWFGLIDYLTPNASEARILAGLPASSNSDDPLEAARCLLSLGCRCVVQKAGGLGSWLVEARGETRVQPFSVTVVDTIGAGDAFNAGFAVALATGFATEEALRWGNAAGALSTRRRGAQAALATRQELKTMLG